MYLPAESLGAEGALRLLERRELADDPHVVFRPGKQACLHAANAPKESFGSDQEHPLSGRTRAVSPGIVENRVFPFAGEDGVAPAVPLACRHSDQLFRPPLRLLGLLACGIEA